MPTNVLATLVASSGKASSSPSSSRAFERPKSIKVTRGGSSEDTSTFSGFTSRCAILCSCNKLKRPSAASISRAQLLDGLLLEDDVEQLPTGGLLHDESQRVAAGKSP